VDAIVEAAVTKVAEEIVDKFIIMCEDLETGEVFELV
jgi:hypothetical protein